MSGQERPGDDGEGLVTAAVAAALLAVSVRSVRRYAEEGRLAPVRLGRNVRYRLADVERLIATGADTSGHEGRQDGRRAADSGQGRQGADMSALADVSVRTVEALREELTALRSRTPPCARS